MHVSNWKEEQDNCCFLLNDPNWKLAIKEGGKTRRSLSKVKNVLIVTKKSDFSNYICSKFSIDYLGSKLSNLMVCLGNSVHGVLGVSEAAIIAEIVAGIISMHPNNQRYFWLFENTLKALVCIVLAVRNRSCIDQEGNQSRIDKPEIISLRTTFFKQGKPFILSTQSILFSQNVSEENQEIEILMSLEKQKLVESLNLPRNIVDRFIYRYVEAKVNIKYKKEKGDKENISNIKDIF